MFTYDLESVAGLSWESSGSLRDLDPLGVTRNELTLKWTRQVRIYRLSASYWWESKLQRTPRLQLKADRWIG